MAKSSGAWVGPASAGADLVSVPGSGGEERSSAEGTDVSKLRMRWGSAGEGECRPPSSAESSRSDRGPSEAGTSTCGTLSPSGVRV